MKRLLITIIAGLVIAFTSLAEAKERLVIGITQFPSTFHPNIDSMLAKTYILSATRRPFTVQDPSWQLKCMLCTKLPTIENGLAKPETAPNGKKGIAVTYTIQPNANWGDGRPVSSKDVIFTWKVGRHPKSGVSGLEFYRRAYKVDAIDEKTFTLHFDNLVREAQVSDRDLTRHLERLKGRMR